MIRVTGKGKRDALREKLCTEGIQTEVYYPRSLHEQECFSDNKAEVFSFAEKASQEIMALPLALPAVGAT
jgi:dTDP-4-amino-4,6-dideoxygalactose transaminase